jgi:hypothetical protein
VTRIATKVVVGIEMPQRILMIFSSETFLNMVPPVP